MAYKYSKGGLGKGRTLKSLTPRSLLAGEAIALRIRAPTPTHGLGIGLRTFSAELPSNPRNPPLMDPQSKGEGIHR